MAKGKLPKVRPAKGQAANTSGKPWESSTYMDEHLKGVIRKPSVAKKVAYKGANKAASPHAEMPKGGNTSSNKPGSYPGV